MPISQLEFMRENIIQDLFEARDFQKSVALRTQVYMCLQQICQPWTGKNTTHCIEQLESVIADADACGRSSIFNWYCNKVSPKLLKEAFKESSHFSYSFDTNTMPISLLLFNFFELTQLSNLDDVKFFTHEHWQWALHWFYANFGELKTLEAIRFDSWKDKEGEKHDKISF